MSQGQLQSDDGEQDDNPLDRITDPDFQFNTNATPLRLFMRTLDPLVDEAKIRVGKCETAEWGRNAEVDGVHVRAVDPANVAMLDVTMPAEGGGFEKWDLPEAAYPYTTLGVRTGTLHKHLKFARMSGRGVDGDGDPVVVKYDEHLRRIETAVTRPSQRTQRVTAWNLIDPDSIRQEPDIPDLSDSLNHVGHVESTDALNDAVKGLNRTDDHVAVRQDPENPDAWQFHADGEGPVSSDFVRFNDGHESDGDAVEGGESSLFSMDYLRDFTRALANAKMDKVTIRWGDESPAVFQFMHEDYGIRGIYMLAPRIRSEDD